MLQRRNSVCLNSLRWRQRDHQGRAKNHATSIHEGERGCCSTAMGGRDALWRRPEVRDRGPFDRRHSRGVVVWRHLGCCGLRLLEHLRHCRFRLLWRLLPRRGLLVLLRSSWGGVYHAHCRFPDFGEVRSGGEDVPVEGPEGCSSVVGAPGSISSREEREGGREEKGWPQGRRGRG